MKELFNDIKNDKTTNLGFLSTVVLIVFTFIFILFFYLKLPPFLPIFNQLPWGEQRLGKTIAIFIPLLISVLIFVLNLVMAAVVYKKIPLVSRMLATTSLLTASLAFLFIAKTIILIL